MPTYSGELEDGRKFSFESDETLNEDQVAEVVASQMATPKTSALGTFAREVAVGAPAAAVAGLTWMGAAALAPASGGLSFAIPAAATLIAGMGTSAIEKKAIHAYAPELEKELEAGREQHAPAAFLGRITAPLPSTVLAPGTVVKGLAALPSVIGRTATAEAQKDVTRAAFQVGLGTGMGVAPTMLPKSLGGEGRLPTLGEVAETATISGLYGQPRWRITAPPLPLSESEVDQTPPKPKPIEKKKKGGESAIQERSATEVPVEPAPGDSQTLGQGIPEPEKPPVPQAPEAPQAEGELLRLKPTYPLRTENGRLVDARGRPVDAEHRLLAETPEPAPAPTPPEPAPVQPEPTPPKPVPAPKGRLNWEGYEKPLYMGAELSFLNPKPVKASSVTEINALTNAKGQKVYQIDYVDEGGKKQTGYDSDFRWSRHPKFKKKTVGPTPEPAATPPEGPLKITEALKPEPGEIPPTEPTPEQNAAPAPEKAKEPWEMTRREWESRNVAVSGVRGPGSPHITDIRQVKPKSAAGSGDRVMLPDGTIWEYKGISAYKADNEGRVNGWEQVDESVYRRGDHKLAVEKALKEGKPVPPEVLADYPDLKPAPERPAATGQEGKTPETLAEIDERLAQIEAELRDLRKGFVVGETKKQMEAPLKNEQTRLMAKRQTLQKQNTPDIEFEHPAPGTPEAAAIEKAIDEANAREDALITKLRDLEKQFEKAKSGTKKEEQLRERVQKAKEAVWEEEKRNAPIKEQRRFMYLEHLVRQGDPAQRMAALPQLLGMRSERLVKRADKLLEQGDKHEAYKLYDQARELGKQARKLADDAFKTLNEQVAAELEKLGATPDEAKFEAGQIVNMQMSYPGMKSVAEAGLRMRAIEGDRVKQRFEKEARALMDEYGVAHDSELSNRLSSALPDESRARSVLDSFKSRYEAEKQAKLKQEQERQTAAAQAQEAELNKARELQKTGKLKWVWVGSDVSSGFWKPIEGKPVKLTTDPDHPYFVHRGQKGGWAVTEESTGLAVGHGKTQGEAIQMANDRITKYGEKYREMVKDHAKPLPPKPSLEPLGPTGGAGPGTPSATQGPDTGAQIEQLASAFKSSKAPLGERIKALLQNSFDLGDRAARAKDTLARALSGLKTTGDALIKTLTSFTEPDAYSKLLGKLSQALETRSWDAHRFEKSVKKAIPQMRRRVAIAKWVDAGGDRSALQEGLANAPERYKQAYRDALNLSGDDLTHAQNIQNYFEARLNEAIAAGVLEHGLEDYIHRIYPRDTPFRQRMLAYVQSGILSRNPSLARKRFFKYDWQAEQAGLNPVQDFLPRILDYEVSLSRAIAARKFVARLSEMKAADGRPIIGIKGAGTPMTDRETGERIGTLIKPMGDLKRNADPADRKNYRGDYVNREYNALSRWKWVAGDTEGKPIFLKGDVAIHPDYVGRVDALLQPSQIRHGRYGGVGQTLLNIGSGFKQTMLDLSGFHQVQITLHALEHRVMPWAIIKDIDFADPDTHGLMEGGITLGGEYHTQREGLMGSSLTRHIPVLGPILESYHSYLFQDLIPRIKMTMALHALKRNRVRFAKELGSGKMSQDALFRRTAEQANAAFGGLNYILLERSKTAQDMSRLIALAPDFLEARGRFAGQALNWKYGGEQRVALVLGALTMWTLSRILNKAIDNQYHLEPENLFNVVYKGNSYGLRTVQGDILHLLTKPIQFWMSRLNPVYGRTAMEFATGRDWFGRKRSMPEQAWDAVSNIIPISLRSNRERTMWESMLNAFGVTARRYNDVDNAFKLAQKWKAAHGVQMRGEFIYDPDKDALRSLKIALVRQDEGGAVKEIQRLLQSKATTMPKLNQYFERYASMPFTGSRANDRKFIADLSEDERMTVESGRQTKQRILKLFRTARNQYWAAGNR